MIAAAVKRLLPPPIDIREILRYARVRGDDAASEERVKELFALAEGELDYLVSYTVLPLSVSGSECRTEALTFNSESLAARVGNCKRIAIFAATVGSKMDRLIKKYEHISARDALLLDAIGAERVEALCDAFIELLEKKEGKLTPRFSPGYGDLPLELQRDVFRILMPEGSLGLTLGEGLLMSPSKSVTAFVGILN